MKIKKLNKKSFDGYVYNFSVKDNHNYIVNDVIVSNCHYCYTNALKSGTNFSNVIDKANDVWGNISLNDRPFQIAIGGAGEPTLHPDFSEFVNAVRSLEIIPNYTTNGMHLSNNVLKATEDYCGGVALSWHPHIEKTFHNAVSKLKEVKTKLNVHVILGNEKSFNDLQILYDLYQNDFDYFVILPYQAVGRGLPLETETVWKKAFKWIEEQNSKKFAFGALFYEYLKNNETNLKIDIYEPEMYSGYRMLDENYTTIYKSSYDLTPKNNVCL